eukprot:gb/GFBE01003406.1/.p1 GENE.gb/GFBE01003406.1/~~gb/GFBE01003406.1/.p1  ORF type:complete len:165 (+),score=18.79 gb/GFBE01003406.1/:1-495(+)
MSAVTVLGKVLGYPSCCIIAHEARGAVGKFGPSEDVRAAMRKIPRGCRYHWVPCASCASQILLGTATFRSLLTYDRPLVDLTSKLDHPKVQREAQKVLTAEEYELYDMAASKGIQSLCKASFSFLEQGQAPPSLSKRAADSNPPKAIRKACFKRPSTGKKRVPM